ncbi:hypothetical protein [Streptomyces sp. AC495_CC817]|uniref:hypothetical protein n=1 Tax=Streptomyces sp. AC495_CC817 TaxID=2823900 RepID=UPI001C26DB98|nr:hypothetical protein [Streptomyces sp. AC495_CC817]
MSTDETPAVPRTRAEMRAAREAAARAADAAVEQDSAPTDAEQSPEEAEQSPAEAPAPVPERALPVSEPAAAQAAMPAPVSARAVSDDRIESAPEDGGPEPEAAPRAARATQSAPLEDAASAARATPRAALSRVRPRGFSLLLLSVLGVLVLVGAGLGVASLTQGPRVTRVQVDPQHAIESSGSRMILTANQSLAAIDPSQITVDPAVPFTVDASGRGVGIRFTVPLDDSTTYKVTVAGVTGTGGGPSADLVESFTTPASSIFLLRRDFSGDDTIFRTDLSGEKAQPIYSAEKINDFRATSTQLVVAIEEDELSKLLVMDREGGSIRELPLPGKGTIGGIQVSERGSLVGYTYSDFDLSDTQGRASVLVTQPLAGGDPEITEVGGKEANILVWQFVPDSSAALFIDFDGALSLVDHSGDAGVQSLGLATTIQGVSRGTYTAVVERLDGTVVELNLTDGSEEPLPASNPDYGTAMTITPFPGGTLRHVTARDDTGMPIGQAVVRVDDEGAATPLVEVGAADSILQACASPSGQYAAVAIAPAVADNPYDQMLLPLPQKVETHLLDLRTGDEIVALTGFDASWCQTAPKF